MKLAGLKIESFKQQKWSKTFQRKFKEIIILCLTLVVLVSCEKKDSSTDSNSSTNTTSEVTITKNIHDSLPTSWVTEFNLIMDNLQGILPLANTYYETINLYAWNDNVADPYSGIEGGAYISGSGDDSSIIFVMEIPNNEFLDNSMHRYSVIAHEYFHTYQKSLNQYMNMPNDKPKRLNTQWLIEGSAAALESIYIQQYYYTNYFLEGLNKVHTVATQNPSIFESADSSDKDINYSSSTFLVLALAKELQLKGHTEAAAFRLILKEFMAANPSGENWQNIFETTFEMSVSSFYSSLSAYTASIETILPSTTLTLESIFN